MFFIQVTAHTFLRITVQYIKLVQQTLYTGGAAQDGTGGEELITGMFKCCATNRTAEVENDTDWVHSLLFESGEVDRALRNVRENQE